MTISVQPDATLRRRRTLDRMLARRVTLTVGLALICGAGLTWWLVAKGDPRGELVTDADQVTGTWELIRLEDMRRDWVYYDVGITLTPHADTWEFLADAGCSTAYRGYLDIAPSGQVTVDVLGAVGAQVGCHGQLKAVPNVQALHATVTMRLTGDNTLSLIDDADNVLGTYHLVRDGHLDRSATSSSSVRRASTTVPRRVHAPSCPAGRAGFPIDPARSIGFAA